MFKMHEIIRTHGDKIWNLLLFYNNHGLENLTAYLV